MKKSSDPADVVLREIEAIGEHSFIPSIGPVKGKILAEIVKKTKPKRILEGRGPLRVLCHTDGQELAPRVEIVSVEKNPEHVRIASKNIKRANMEEKITMVQGDGRTELQKLSGSFDLVFLDAEKTQYLAYLKAVEKNLDKGIVIVADNVGML